MKVLVTGHHGYIGSVLTDTLRGAGHTVHGVDAGLFSAARVGPAPAQVPETICDVRDVSVDQLRGFDAIIHLAGISNDPLGDLNPDITLEINHHASVRLARLARQAGVSRFLFASSCSLYGAASPDETLDETAPFRPVTVYGRSKILAEQAISALADDAFSPVFLRCATVYGMSPRLRGDLVVNNLTGHAVTQGLVFLKSDGTPWRPLVHVRDVCEAYRALLTAERSLIHNESFNVGRSNANHQVSEVADLVQSLVPGSRIEYADHAGPDTRCYRVTCGKLEQRIPQYRPTWTVGRGISELRDAYHAHGLTLEMLTGPATQRIRQILELQQRQLVAEDLRWVAAPPPNAHSALSMTGRIC